MNSNTELKPSRSNPGEHVFTEKQARILEFCATQLGHAWFWNECRDQRALIVTIHHPERLYVKTETRPFNPIAYDRDTYDLITELEIQVQHVKGSHICVSRNDVLLSHLERYDSHNGNKQRTLRYAVFNLMEKVKNALGT